MAGARVQPVVLAFEDLHWADPTTLDLLRGIAERGALAPLFIVATTRPEFRPPWGMRSHHGTISLAPLDRAQVRDMVAELSARHALPRGVVEDVAARTGGVPLFVEEVTRLLLERSVITAWRSTGATLWAPLRMSHLARAYAELDQFDDAWRCVGEAMTAVETVKERWCEAEIHRVAGEITLMSPEPDAAKAEAYFERALAVARKQQAKSWELRGAMSMARLWRDQGKRQQARNLLAPVYGWFTEGFDTLDLKEAKTLLDELHA
jgi:hypothetical protein